MRATTWGHLSINDDLSLSICFDLDQRIDIFIAGWMAFNFSGFLLTWSRLQFAHRKLGAMNSVGVHIEVLCSFRSSLREEQVPWIRSILEFEYSSYFVALERSLNERYKLLMSSIFSWQTSVKFWVWRWWVSYFSSFNICQTLDSLWYHLLTYRVAFSE
jgi:hypothetical protein